MLSPLARRITLAKLRRKRAAPSRRVQLVSGSKSPDYLSLGTAAAIACILDLNKYADISEGTGSVLAPAQAGGMLAAYSSGFSEKRLRTGWNIWRSAQRISTPAREYEANRNSQTSLVVFKSTTTTAFPPSALFSFVAKFLLHLLDTVLACTDPHSDLHGIAAEYTRRQEKVGNTTGLSGYAPISPVGERGKGGGGERAETDGSKRGPEHDFRLLLLRRRCLSTDPGSSVSTNALF